MRKQTDLIPKENRIIWVNITIRENKKGNSVNVEWILNKTHKCRSFGKTELVESWINALGFYDLLHKQKIRTEINYLMRLHTGKNIILGDQS